MTSPKCPVVSKLPNGTVVSDFGELTASFNESFENPLSVLEFRDKVDVDVVKLRRKHASMYKEDPPGNFPVYSNIKPHLIPMIPLRISLVKII